MKKILVISFAMVLVFGVNAQVVKPDFSGMKLAQPNEVIVPNRDVSISISGEQKSTINSGELKEILLSTNSNPKRHKDTYTYVNYVLSTTYNNHILGSGASWIGSTMFLFPDSMAGKYGYPQSYPTSGVFSKGIPGLGYIFDPYSPLFGSDTSMLMADEYENLFNYRLDTLVVYGDYRIANYNPASRDTLRVFLSSFDVYSPKSQSSTEYVNTSFVDNYGMPLGNCLIPAVKYSTPSTPQQGSIVSPKAVNTVSFDYILGVQDSINLPIGYVSIKPFLVPTNYEVPAGSVLGVMIKYIPGYTYTNNDTLIKTEYDNGGTQALSKDIRKNVLDVAVVGNNWIDLAGGYNIGLAEDFDVRYKKNTHTYFGLPCYRPLDNYMPLLGMDLSMGTTSVNYHPIATSDSATAITGSTVSLFGTITPGVDSIVERGFLIKEKSVPTYNISQRHPVSGVSNNIMGAFSSLTPNTEYDFAAYVITTNRIKGGYIYRAESKSFRTLSPMPMQVTTKPVTNITKTSATLHGALDEKDDLLNGYGFVYRKQGASSWTQVNYYDVSIEDINAFYYTSSGLAANTKYEVTAYAISAITGTTYYGDTLIFQTQSAAPQVLTLDATDITENTVVLNGNVIEDDETVLLQGFEWRKQGESNFNKASSQTMSPLRSSVSSLQTGTNYEFKAFAQTAANTYYGELKTFKTSGGTAITDISTIDNLKLYPNPANDIIHVESELPIEQVVIYDISGRQLRQIQNPDNGTFSIGELSNGIYWIKISCDKRTATYKIIKSE